MDSFLIADVMVVLLVYKCTAEVPVDGLQLHEWLCRVQASIPTARAFVVGTHASDLAANVRASIQTDEEWHRLCTRFTAPAGEMTLSLHLIDSVDTQIRISQLQAALLESSLEKAVQVQHEGWLAIPQRLLEDEVWSQPCILNSQELHELIGHEVPYLTSAIEQLWHPLGVCLHFNTPALRQLWVIQPQAVCDVFKAVLNPATQEDIRQHGGVASTELLQEAFQELCTDNKQQLRTLMDILLKFDLAFKRPHVRGLVFPHLIPPNRPCYSAAKQTRLDKARSDSTNKPEPPTMLPARRPQQVLHFAGLLPADTALSRKVFIKLRAGVPKGLFGRLICRLIQYQGVSEVPNYTTQNAIAVQSHDGAVATIELVPIAQELRFIAWTEHSDLGARDSFIDHLCTVVTEITSDTFPGLQNVEFVPCNLCDTTSDELLLLSHCKEYFERDPQATINCKGCGNNIPVSQLLGSIVPTSSP